MIGFAVAAAVLLTLMNHFHKGSPGDKPQINDASIGGWSPSRDFYIETNILEPGDIRQIWLVSAANPKDRELLCTPKGPSEVLVSEDDKWLAVNDGAGSNVSMVILYKQRKGVQYKEQSLLSNNAWKFFKEHNKGNKSIAINHTYAKGLTWTDDHTLLLELQGKGYDGTNSTEIGVWLCLYDANTKTFSTDLARHNQRHVTLPAD